MGKTGKNIIRIVAVALLCIFTFGLTGCTKKLSREEATLKVSELVEKSYELNEIVFGKGLEYIETEESKNTRYALVKENDKYNSINDIRIAINEVFSEDYGATLKTTAFVGQSGVVDGTKVPERYIENEQGFLVLKNDIVLDGSVNVDGEKQEISYYGFKVNKYDTSTIEIKKISRRFIEAYITSEDGKETILVTLILEENGWRIDSPTY